MKKLTSTHAEVVTDAYAAAMVAAEAAKTAAEASFDKAHAEGVRHVVSPAAVVARSFMAIAFQPLKIVLNCNTADRVERLLAAADAYAAKANAYAAAAKIAKIAKDAKDTAEIAAGIAEAYADVKAATTRAHWDVVNMAPNDGYLRDIAESLNTEFRNSFADAYTDGAAAKAFYRADSAAYTAEVACANAKADYVDAVEALR